MRRAVRWFALRHHTGRCGLRDYGLPPMVWDSGLKCVKSAKKVRDCIINGHTWGDIGPEHHKGQVPQTNTGASTIESSSAGGQTAGSGQFCQFCGAWRGSLGLEPTPELYIQHIVEIFREVKRVLRKDGTVWLNLGDSYASGKGDCFNLGGGENSIGNKRKDAGAHPLSRGNVSDLKKSGLKPKDLCGIPWRVALALQADGWWLRQAMPWVKRSAMPESAEDRPASALEYMFLLTKSQKYYFDMDAVRMPQSENTHPRYSKSVEAGFEPPPAAKKDSKEITGPGHDKFREYTPKTFIGGRNFRNTDLFYQSIQPPHGMIFAGDEPVGLDVNPYPQKAAHFATFPPKLCEPLILSGSSERGCCPECGAPWERVVEKSGPEMRDVKSKYPGEHSIATRKYKHNESGTESKTIGWKPTCKCYKTEPLPEYPKRKAVDMPEKTLTGWQRGPGSHDKIPQGNYSGAIKRDESDEEYEIRIGPIRQERLRLVELWKPLKTIPCTVLDPFFGSGTVGTEAHKHGRNFIGIELSKTYLDDIAAPRIESKTEQMRLF